MKDSTTGLKIHEGDLIVTEPGGVSGYDVHGSIVIQSENVIVSGNLVRNGHPDGCPNA